MVTLAKNGFRNQAQLHIKFVNWTDSVNLFHFTVKSTIDMKHKIKLKFSWTWNILFLKMLSVLWRMFHWLTLHNVLDQSNNFIPCNRKRYKRKKGKKEKKSKIWKANQRTLSNCSKEFQIVSTHFGPIFSVIWIIALLCIKIKVITGLKWMPDKL